MGFADRLKKLTTKAEEAAAEHKDQIHKAVDQAGALADKRTHGKYRDQIRQAGAKADGFVDDLKAPAEGAPPPAAGPAPPSPPETP